MSLAIVKAKLNPVHSKLNWQLKRNERVFEEAVQKWFAFTLKQIQTDLRTKFQKDIASELTDWEYLQSQGQEILKPATLSVMQSGGGEAYKMFQVKGAFDVLNVESVKAAQKFTADLVRQVNSETKKGIRTYISTGIKEGKGMPKIARELRPLVGLTQNQTKSVINYRNLLSDKEKFPNLSASDVDRKTTRYADKTHRRRARTIARTETARAQTIGYAQGMEDLGVEQLEHSVHVDERLCEICAPLEGTKYKVSEAKGVIPVHPNCRCALLPVIGGKSVSRYTGEVGSVAPEQLQNALVGDLVKRWESAISRSNKWVLKDKLKKLGYDTSGKPITGKPPIAVLPAITPAPLPVTKLPQEIQDLVVRWQTAVSRSSKWTYQNKLKQLGYNVKTGVYKPTGIPLPKPRVKPAPKPDAVKPPAKPKPAEGIKYNTAEDYRKALLDLEAGGKSKVIESQIASIKTKRSALYRKSETLRDERNALRVSGKGTKAELDRLWDAKEKVSDEIQAMNIRISDLRRGQKVTQKEMLSVLNETDNIAGIVSKAELGKFSSTADDILSWIPKNSVSSKDQYRLSRLFIRKEVKGASAGSNLGSYNNMFNRITVSTHSNRVFAHEFGHHISYKLDKVMRAQNSFFRARTAGESTRSLGGAFRSISGKRDKFAKYEVYAGRIYKDGHFPEVISVGIEYIWKNALSAAKKDPEWFRMVISALKGLPTGV